MISSETATPQGIPNLPVQYECRCNTVPTNPVITPTMRATRTQAIDRRRADLLGFGACPSAGEFDSLIGIKHHLTHPDSFRSHFDTFIVSHPFKRFLQREDARRRSEERRVGKEWSA